MSLASSCGALAVVTLRVLLLCCACGGPPSAEEHFKLGRERVRESGYNGTIEHVSAAIDMKTDDPRFHRCRGLAYCQAGECDKAIAELTVAISLGAGDSRVYVGRERTSALAISRVPPGTVTKPCNGIPIPTRLASA